VALAGNMWVTENSIIHIDQAAQSVLMMDFSDRCMWMTEFSVAHMGFGLLHAELFFNIATLPV
jgi:hypothetical protein